MKKQKQLLIIFILIFLSTTFVAQARHRGRKQRKQHVKEAAAPVQQIINKQQKATKNFSF